jgi:AhpD family alkylhydroperoxidase
MNQTTHAFESPRMRIAKAAPAPHRALVALSKSIELDPTLRELVNLRTSIVNGCAYCIETHTKDARQAGESEQRLYALAAWRVSPLFDDRERAVLALTDAVTLISDEHVPRAVWDEAAALFSEDELAQLLWAITAMNAWNRIAIATRMESPYERAPFDRPLLQAASS